MKKKYPNNALEAMVEGVKPFYEDLDEQGVFENSATVSPSLCIPWSFHDRCDVWMSESKSSDLIDSIKQHGQKIPAIVRETTQHGSDIKYEIIAGKRRWYACKQLGIELSIKVVAADDKDAAVLMQLENKDRKDISDFKRALSYKNQYEGKVFKSLDEMSKALNISESHLSRMINAAGVINYPFVMNYVDDITELGIKYCNDLAALMKKGGKVKEVFRLERISLQKKRKN